MPAVTQEKSARDMKPKEVTKTMKVGAVSHTTTIPIIPGNFMKPCNSPCPKCGSIDVGRKFYNEGFTIHEDDACFDSLNKFVGGEYPQYKVIRDFIRCKCKCCQYVWGVRPLTKKQYKSLTDQDAE